MGGLWAREETRRERSFGREGPRKVGEARRFWALSFSNAPCVRACRRASHLEIMPVTPARAASAIPAASGGFSGGSTVCFGGRLGREGGRRAGANLRSIFLDGCFACRAQTEPNLFHDKQAAAVSCSFQGPRARAEKREGAGSHSDGRESSAPSLSRNRLSPCVWVGARGRIRGVGEYTARLLGCAQRARVLQVVVRLVRGGHGQREMEE